MKMPSLTAVSTEAKLLLIGIPLLLWTLAPVYHMVLFAISPKQSAFEGNLWPDHPTLNNFAIVFQEKQCRNCHSLDGQGGKRGPALDQVALRLTRDQLVRQIIQRGGNMPAYGKNLSPAEATAVVALVSTPANWFRAITSSFQANSNAFGVAVPGRRS